MGKEIRLSNGSVGFNTRIIAPHYGGDKHPELIRVLNNRRKALQLSIEELYRRMQALNPKIYFSEGLLYDFLIEGSYNYTLREIAALDDILRKEESKHLQGFWDYNWIENSFERETRLEILGLMVLNLITVEELEEAVNFGQNAIRLYLAGRACLTSGDGGLLDDIQGYVNEQDAINGFSESKAGWNNIYPPTTEDHEYYTEDSYRAVRNFMQSCSSTPFIVSKGKLSKAELAMQGIDEIAVSGLANLASSPSKELVEEMSEHLRDKNYVVIDFQRDFLSFVEEETEETVQEAAQEANYDKEYRVKLEMGDFDVTIIESITDFNRAILDEVEKVVDGDFEVIEFSLFYVDPNGTFTRII